MVAVLHLSERKKPGTAARGINDMCTQWHRRASTQRPKHHRRKRALVQTTALRTGGLLQLSETRGIVLWFNVGLLEVP